MKFFISADIEGTTGIVDWEETNLGKTGFSYISEQMTREVRAACLGAIEAGAEEIVIKDAHDSARNLDPSNLPYEAKLIRGWTKGPLCMMAGLDESFDGVIFTGYHSAAGTNGNPLAHTLTTKLEYLYINDELASEFMINAYAAALYKVPVIFLCGDKLLCEQVKKLNPNIRTVAVSEGIGNASMSIHPELALDRIKKETLTAASDDLSKYVIPLPDTFKVQVGFKEHFMAYRGGFYPGAKQIGPKALEFESSNYMDVLKLFLFVL